MATWTHELNKTLKITWPLTLGLLGQHFFGMIDSMMVGHHSTVELAAASFVNNLTGPALVVIYGFTSHVGVLVAQLVGQNGGAQAGKIVRHAFLYNLILALVLVAILEVINQRLDLLHQPAEVIATSHTFLQLITWSMIPVALFNAFRQYSDGLQKTKPPMLIVFAGVLINTAMNWYLIYGHGGAPELGIVGAGIATLTARTFMFITMMIWVFRAKMYKLFLGGLWSRKFEMHIAKSAVSIGLPSALQYLFESGIFYAAAMMMGLLGTMALAANQIVMNIIVLLYMLPLSISIATSVRVGQAVGANNAAAARAIGYGSLYLSTIATFFCAVLMICGRGLWPFLFTVDNEVVLMARDLFIIASFFQIFDGAQCVLVGALRGMSDVRVPTLIMFVTYWICGGALAYIFGFKFGYGHIGIWAGLAVSVILTALALTYRFEITSRKRLHVA